jgi:tRNA G18 (ribose-2'-O)-methylase SpoU
MGTVFQVPWTRIDWQRDREILRDAGFAVAAFALAQDAISLDELASTAPERLAVVLGAEGAGLSDLMVADCDLTVRIPMAGGVDSLNVAAAAAVAMWALRMPSPISHLS